ncbi:MAG: hypothetical protein QGI83_11860 [Candidatus Latescibacteria bacterium]|jgi:hypothetical protein|nr:hypothetical protein [Candidatus Latescibacterota bacterium]
MPRTITAADRDGFVRKVYPSTVALTFQPGELPSEGAARLLDSEGEELPIQLDGVEAWEDGSIRRAELTFAPTLDPLQEKAYSLEHGPEVRRSAQVRNPLTVSETSSGIDVQQGPVVYSVRKQRYNLVNQVRFGDATYLRSGARGPILVLDDDRELLPVGDVEIQVETRGPWAGRLRVTGTYPDGYAFATRLDFVSGRSWFGARHTISEGDRSRIRATVVEAAFDLPAAPLATAFGARTRADAVPTTWGVVTDGVLTVDVATTDAWTRTGYVRYECDADGAFRALFPYDGRPCEIFYHYLYCAPDDIRNTPAAAMVAGVECRVVE